MSPRHRPVSRMEVNLLHVRRRSASEFPKLSNGLAPAGRFSGLIEAEVDGLRGVPGGRYSGALNNVRHARNAALSGR